MRQEPRHLIAGDRSVTVTVAPALLLRLSQPSHPVTRLALAVGLIGAATLVRAAFDPFLFNQAAYVTYLFSSVIATWLCGVRYGVISTVLAAFVGNHLFVAPREDFALYARDWIGMAAFVAIGGGLVWLVGRWRRVESVLRQQVDELHTIFDTVPAALFVTRDPQAAQMTGNRIAAEYLRVPLGHNLSKTAPLDERPTTFRVMKDGRELTGEELPVQMAIARGVEVRDYGFDLVYEDGTTRPLFGNVAPLRDEHGRVRGSVGAFIDLSERKRLETELRQRMKDLETHVTELAESEARYRTMGETVPYGVWLCDPDGGSRYVSDSFLELLDMTLEEQQQFGWTHRLVPEDVDPMMKKWLRCVETGEMWDSEHRVTDRHGAIHTVLTRGLPVRDAQGRITCWVGVHLDITERKAMEVRLREQAEDLARANRVKDEFLATLSHELRTPLNAIVGWADMLRRGKLAGEAATRATESIFRNAQTQSQLINDVLDVSRIISGQTRIETQPLDPAVVLQHALESVRPAAQAKDVRIAIDIHPVSVPVSADPGRLQQVFWNLMANAIKFTPSGGEVRVGLRCSDSELQVEVSDTGIGISPEFLPHVFERFRQHDSSSTRRYGGLGLGLAIVRHLVELHGGRVTAESAGEGRGATFTVRLPVQPLAERRHAVQSVARPVPAIAPTANDVPSLCGVRVLVVDDEPEALEVASSVLRYHGAAVATAGTAAEALEQVGAFAPAVLLVDLAMPEVDGYALIERIRSGGGTRSNIPAIAFTAYAREDDRRRALLAGFELHLAKPVDAHALVRAIVQVREPGDR